MLAAAAVIGLFLTRQEPSSYDDQAINAGRNIYGICLGLLLIELAQRKWSNAVKQACVIAALGILTTTKEERNELVAFKNGARLVDNPRGPQFTKIPAIKVENSVGRTAYKTGKELSDVFKEADVLLKDWQKENVQLSSKFNTLTDKYNDGLATIKKLNNYIDSLKEENARLSAELGRVPSQDDTQYPIAEPGYLDLFASFFTENTKVKSHKMKIWFGTTYIAGNPQRDKLSEMVAKTHEEYAKRWNLIYNPVTENLLKGRCDASIYSDEAVDCVPYWNKIAVLQRCLDAPKINDEEWCVVIDDDMPVTNMEVDPRDAINKLRRGIDSSVIVARDVAFWQGDTATAVNTGALFFRKDDQARDVLNRIWKKRNSWGSGTAICRTLGTCKNQETLHEQTAMTMVLKEDRSLLDSVVTVVLPRDTYNGQEIALNTFERAGCFRRDQEHWGSEQIDYSELDSGYPEGAWREGDWMGQTAGVPVNGWYCSDYNNGKKPGPIRKDKLQAMIAKIKR